MAKGTALGLLPSPWTAFSLLELKDGAFHLCGPVIGFVVYDGDPMLVLPVAPGRVATSEDFALQHLDGRVEYHNEMFDNLDAAQAEIGRRQLAKQQPGKQRAA